MPVLLPLLALVGLAAVGAIALVASQSDDGRSTKKLGAGGDPSGKASKLPGGPGSSLAWDEEAIRVAACAMWANGIRTPVQMAEGIAHAVYAGHEWPPKGMVALARRKLWLDLIAFSKKVIDDPEAYCG